MSKPELAPRVERWTRIEEYLGAFARRRTARRSRQPGLRTQPESPRLLLSTLPFAALISFLLVLVIAFAVLAWPGRPVADPLPAPPREVGNAPPGWFDEAKKDFR